jgi:hypothetical protein
VVKILCVVMTRKCPGIGGKVDDESIKPLIT